MPKIGLVFGQMNDGIREYKCLCEALRRYGWDVVTYGPGDGTVRYRLVRAGMDYFQAEGPTALGRANAIAMMRGALHVLENARLEAEW
jgi:hypothetical protein